MASTLSTRSNSPDEATTRFKDNPNAEPALTSEAYEDAITAEDSNDVNNIVASEEPAKKAKKKRKSKSQRATKSGSGFEEYYVDAPLTPAEYEDEQGLYHSSLTFAQRVETAIQRYAAKRNMNSIRKNIFDKYLVNGGVEAGPKMFSGGIDALDLDTSDRHDIALAAATNFVPFNRGDPKYDLHEVDFEGCLKSFLSHIVPGTFDLTSQEYIKSLVGVIRNFLNYLLYHDVCPEYQDQIQASKILCDQGERELWAIAENIVQLPGDFNKACSVLYGGIFQGQWVAPSTWLTEEDPSKMSQGMSPALARQIFKMGIVANTSPEQFEQYELQNKSNSIQIQSEEDVSMEVVETIPSSADVQHLYASRGTIKPLGKLLTKTWHTPFMPTEDLTEAEELAHAGTLKTHKSYEFWIEDDILRNCFPGMKIDATVKELSIGISYFDAIQGVYCSFFDISTNQRMTGWRVPEGEGNWLPMRGTGGGASEEVEGDDGDGRQDDEKRMMENADNNVLDEGKEETVESKLAEPASERDLGGHKGEDDTT